MARLSERICFRWRPCNWLSSSQEAGEVIAGVCCVLLGVCRKNSGFFWHLLKRKVFCKKKNKKNMYFVSLCSTIGFFMILASCIIYAVWCRLIVSVCEEGISQTLCSPLWDWHFWENSWGRTYFSQTVTNVAYAACVCSHMYVVWGSLSCLPGLWHIVC